MKIKTLSVYTANLSYAGSAYAFAGGRSFSTFLTTVVELTADTGLSGYGEVCPCGPNYMPAFAEGMPSSLELLAPCVLGQDPTQIAVISNLMDQAVCGQAVAKAAIDIACWDLLGKACNLPVYTLLGGLQSESMPLHRIVPLAEPAQMKASLKEYRQQGFRHFQLKLGHEVTDDIELLRFLSADRPFGEFWVGDINAAWRRDEAMRFSRALEDLDLYLEQPCREYCECLSVRRQSRHRIKLDEALNSVEEVQQAIRDDAMDAMALKVSRLGGLTKSRLVRDICSSAGIPMTIEDAWGSGIATAAYAHLAASTDPRVLLNTTDLHNYNTQQLAEGAPDVSDGRMRLSERPGLGVVPDFQQLTLRAEYME